ncbi:MAG: hypothetical protein ABSE73_18235 [Planctomycetota bacterium]
MTAANDSQNRYEPEDPALRRAGEAVARLDKPEPPPDLVTRTLARIAASYRPVKRAFWLFRPIFNPVARLAAAAAIVLLLVPMTDLNLATVLGARIEERIIGRPGTDHVEDFIDGLLVRNGARGYPQYELEAWVGSPRPYYPHPPRAQGHPARINRVG